MRARISAWLTEIRRALGLTDPWPLAQADKHCRGGRPRGARQPIVAMVLARMRLT
jgi:hypothetical protein